MVWNEKLKRNIPKKFSVIDILDVCDIVDCLHSQKPNYNFENEAYYLLTLDNISREGYIDLKEKYYISEVDYVKWTSKICVHENDFVITNAGRAGDIGKIPKGVECAIGRNITAIRPRKINPYYLRQFFKSNYLTEQINSNLDCGAFFKSFNVKSIKKIKLLMPDESTYTEYNKIISKIINRIENNVSENEQLSSLRDFLLPLLMNGQVGFKEG